MTVRKEQAGPDSVEAAQASRDMLFRMAALLAIKSRQRSAVTMGV